MGAGACGSQPSRVRGVIYSFDPNSRLGVINAPGVAQEVHFYESTGQNLAPGTEVNFVLQVLPDGSAQGVEVAIGPAIAQTTPDAGQITGTVKVFNDSRGYGFISAPGHQQDIYFQRRDMDEASQTLLTMLGGPGIQNCTAHLRLEALPDGRFHGRMVNLAEAGATLFENASVAGMIRAFNEEGTGAINVPGAQGLDLMCSQSDLSLELQNKLRQGGIAGMAGTTVWCRLSAVNGVWHAKEVTQAGDGMPKASEGSKGAGKGLMKAEKKIIPGAELLGTMKAWNHEKGYGFMSVEGQQLDVYFQPYDLMESLKQRFDAAGPEGCGIAPGVVMHFWLQLMPGTGRFRGRNVSLAPPGTPASDANSVTEAIRAAQVVFEEEAQSQSGGAASSIPSGGASSTSILVDGAELCGEVKTFNPGQDNKGFGFLTAEGDATDVYFQTKDMRPEDQQQLLQPGFQLMGRRVWFWVEMLDGGRTGRWRAHNVSLSSEGGKRPAEARAPAAEPQAKRQKVDGEGVVQPGQRLTGSVSSFAAELGGTLSSPGLQLPITFQKDQLPSGTESVQPGQSVEFELIKIDENQFAAKNLILIS